MTAFTVREARPDELDDAGRLVADAYLAQGGIDASDPEYLDEIRDARRRAETCPILVAAEEGTGRLLGCVTYVPGPGTPFSEMEVDGEAGFRMLGVAPWAQRRGVGEALARACADRAEGRAPASPSARSKTASTPGGCTWAGRAGQARDFELVPGIRRWRSCPRLDGGALLDSQPLACVDRRPAACGAPAGADVLLTHRPSTMAFGPGLHVFRAALTRMDWTRRSLHAWA
ncbi:MAG: GNAT family N-acetyltransferase [Chloroflexota bacterium]